MTKPIEQLLDFKSKLEQSISQLTDERENLMEKIARKRVERSVIQARKIEDTQKLIQLKVERLKLSNRTAMYEAYVKDIREVANKIDAQVNDQVRLKDFEQEVMKLIENFNGAMDYFRDDSLQMELMKRANTVRERRVEYTMVENEYKELLRKVEDLKREKERKEMAERQRLREIEEQEQRERYLKSRGTLTSFNQNQSGALSPIISQEVKLTDTKLPEINLSEMKQRERKLPEIGSSSLSQFMRW